MSSLVANSPKDGSPIVLPENLHHLAVTNNPLSVRPSRMYCVPRALESRHALCLSQKSARVSVPSRVW
jgi:hypothetical protein